MTKTEEIKNEVARNFKYENNEPYKDWGELMLDCHGRKSIQLLRAIDEAITLYHTRLLEEAGKELPDKIAIDYKIGEFGKTGFKNYADSDNEYATEYHFQYSAELMAEWMRSQASLLLASQKEEIERLRKALRKTQICYKTAQTCKYNCEGTCKEAH